MRFKKGHAGCECVWNVDPMSDEQLTLLSGDSLPTAAKLRKRLAKWKGILILP